MKLSEQIEQLNLDHTPGPWTVEDNLDNIVIYIPYWNVAEIHNVTGIDADRDTCLKDADLISAAPELLEAFKLAHEFLDSLPEGWLGKTSGDIGALNDFYIKSRAVIEKLKQPCES